MGSSVSFPALFVNLLFVSLKADILRAGPLPEEVKWSAGVFTVLHSPQETPRDKLGSSSKINGTQPLQRGRKLKLRLVPL